MAWRRFVHSFGWGNFGQPCELHSVLRIKPRNWTFPNCNTRFIKQTKQQTCDCSVAFGKTCPTLGALLFAWQQLKPVWVVRKVRTDILLANLVCFDVQCLPLKNPPNFRRFDDVVLLYVYILLFFSFLNCFYITASSCLPSFLLPSSFIIIYFLAPDEDNFLSKALVFPCFSSYRWIHFPKSVLSVLSTLPVVVHSFLRKRMFSFIFMKPTGSCVVY